MAVPHFAMTITNAPGHSLPDQLASIGPYLQAVAEIFGLIVVPHKPQKSHVYWCHTQLESLKMQAKMLPKAIEHLHNHQTASSAIKEQSPYSTHL